MVNQTGISAYKKVSTQSGVHDASPHRLIQMLIDAAIGKIAAAKGLMENQKMSLKGEHIGTAIAIIDSLKNSLDTDAGGEIADNLGALYEYMMICLTEANIFNNADKLDEVIKLLKPIKEAWDTIPAEVQNDLESKNTQTPSGTETATG